MASPLNERISQKTIPQDQGQSSSRTQGTGTQGTRGTERQMQRLPGRGYEQPYSGAPYGGQPYGGQQGYQGQGAQGGGYGMGCY